jgi:hypothetical protein
LAPAVAASAPAVAASALARGRAFLKAGSGTLASLLPAGTDSMWGQRIEYLDIDDKLAAKLERSSSARRK